MQIAQTDFSSGGCRPQDCTKMTQEYLMYFKEFSCKTAENMQARCVPRFNSASLELRVGKLRPVGGHLGDNGSVVDYAYRGSAVAEKHTVAVDPTLYRLVSIFGSVGHNFSVGFYRKYVRPRSKNNHVGYGICSLRFKAGEYLSGCLLKCST